MNNICYRSYDCPKCGENLQVPYIIQGLYQIYSDRVRCKTRGCGDISKHFFKHLISEKAQWKWGKVPVPPKEKPVKPPKPLKEKKKREPKKKIVRQKKVINSEAGKANIPKNIENIFLKHGLSFKETIAVKAFLEGASKKDAMISAGYAKTTASNMSSIVFGKPCVQETIQEIMERRGVTEEKLVDVLFDGLDANKVISALVIAPNGEGMKDANSMTKDFVEVPDHDARHKFMVSGLKLHGHLVDKGAGPAASAPETYEQWRLRMGLDRMTPEEALEKLMEEKAALLAQEEAEGQK